MTVPLPISTGLSAMNSDEMWLADQLNGKTIGLYACII